MFFFSLPLSFSILYFLVCEQVVRDIYSKFGVLIEIEFMQIKKSSEFILTTELDVGILRNDS